MPYPYPEFATSFGQSTATRQSQTVSPNLDQMEQGDVSDPSDWSNTALSSLYPLDSNLRCLICKDFYTAPVITTCLHTFCSLCIRRSLSAEPICPACRTPNISDNGLRQNKVVADLVENFLAARPVLLQMAKKQESTAPPAVSLPSQVEERTRIPEVEPVVNIQPLPETIRKEPIQCPVCNRPFRSVEEVDRHIDNCISQPTPPPPPSYNLRQLRQAPVAIPTPYERPQILTRNSQNPLPNSKAVTRIPKVNYAMYNDSKLRGLLAELGLPTYGNRSLLSARHKEYVNLHNANIDRPHPQSRIDLIRQLERWDATQQTLSRGEKRKELDGKEWGMKCKEDFADLAKQARASAKRRKVEQNVSDDAQQQNVEASNGETANNMGSSIVMSSQEETVAL